MADDITNCRDLEAHLAPYVDGEAPPATRRAIDAHLDACPPCRDHAETEAAARDLVRSHRDSLAARAPESLRERCRELAQSPIAVDNLQSPIAIDNPQSTIRQSPISNRQSARLRQAFGAQALRRWAPLSLAATLVLAVAGVFLFGLNDRVEALAASLAVDHVKCFKVSDSDRRADAVGAERRWQADQGWPIVVPETSPAEQLTLVDVRRCFTTDGRSAHMMYRWRGAPLSLYVLPESIGRDRVVDKMGHEAVIWCANSRTYALVTGEGHAGDLAPIVEYMKAHAK
jgi:anti-sigma factor (TIGR02949 family)